MRFTNVLIMIDAIGNSIVTKLVCLEQYPDLNDTNETFHKTIPSSVSCRVGIR